jgi:hypothetical protein
MTSDTLTRRERIALFALAISAAVMRVALLLRYRFDSDEPQHLHVAWGWTAGLVQYRDVFDNHSPLFHIVTAPLLAMFGERADILILMRLPMLALFAAVLWGTYVLAARHWSRRVALWSVLVVAIFPPFALKSIEYRTDNLWTALWIVALVILLRGRLTAPRLFLAGLALGAALATSMKTLLLVVTLLIAAAIVRSVHRTAFDAKRLLPALAGFAIVPAIVLIAFAMMGALDEMFYCVVTFNGFAAGARWHAWIGRLAWPLLVYAIWRMAHRRGNEQPARLFLGALTALCCVTVLCLWTLITPRDFLAVMPLLAIFAVTWMLRMARPLRALVAYGVLATIALFHYADKLENRTDEHITMMDQVLRLSRRGEFLMDIKGETIFRQRPFLHAFEAITRHAMREGKIRDTIAHSMIEKRTYVAQADGPFLPPLGRQFMRRNFIDMGRIRVAGQWIGEDGAFTIAIPGEYVVVSAEGVARGTVDGAPNAPRVLAAGAHRFDRAVAKERVAVMWAPAFARGGSPFHLRDLEF